MSGGIIGGKLTDRAIKAFVIGPYPHIGLSAARVELSEVKFLLLENKDPVSQRRINRA